MKKYQGIELDVIKDEISKFCSFSLGKNKILSLEPSFNPLILQRENQRIKEALMLCVKYGSMPFFGMKDSSNLLMSAQKGRVLTIQECLDVHKMIHATQMIFNYLNQCEEEVDEVKELVESLIFHSNLKNELEHCFHEDGSVFDHATEELLNIRAQLVRVEHELQQVTSTFLQKNKDSLIEQIITTRNDRCVVLVKVGDKNKFGGFIHGESASGQAVYVEPNLFVTVNNRKLVLLQKEKEEIERILILMSKKIQEVGPELLNNLETIALLDALFAKAQWGKKEEATVANFTQKKEICLEKARHPLISKEQAVLNTYVLQESTSLLLITGANTGGKTVSLKCIGIAVLMTYCGMPVCCENATIPFFDQIFIDIGDEQSIIQSLSTFSSHLSKLSMITKHATKNSLVLLDELGSGTDPKEGESLAIAILSELRHRKTMTVATTHYGKLKAYGKKHDDILIASVQFDLEKLQPTYRYIEGLSGQSNAFDIAKRFGLEESIIEHARSLKEAGKSKEDQLIERLEKQLSENEELKNELEETIKNQKNKIEEVEMLKKQILQDKEKLKKAAQQEANELIQKAQENAELLLDELKNANLKYHDALKIKEKLDELNNLSEDENLEEKDLHIGDFVELIQSQQIAKVISIDKSRVTINLNGKTIHTKKNRLRSTDRKIEEKKPAFSVKTRKFHEFKSECNLLGLRVEEALSEVSKFLDDALFYNYPQVRIVHGDGSGALRKAIHDYLKKNKNVSSFRLGFPTEGSTGVTIVTLKGGE